MRKKRLMRVGLLVVLALVLVNIGLRVLPGVFQDRYDLTLKISTLRKEYKLGDEIPITFTMKNNGKRTFPEKEPWVDRISFKRQSIGGHGKPTTSYGFGLQVRHKDGKPCVYAGGSGMVRSSYSAEEIRVKGGASRSKRCTLNARILLSEPGTYILTGRFGPGPIEDSEPVEIVVSERTPKEMEEHVSELVQASRTATGVNARRLAIWRLVYTRDYHAVPALIDLEYSGSAPKEAFMQYLPISEEIKNTLLNTAMKRGLTHNIIGALQRFGCSEAELKEVIGKWLRSEDWRSMRVALLATEYFPDDSHTPALVKLARGEDNSIRIDAIRALAFNRTEEGVEVLTEALQDADREIRRTAKHAIRTAFGSERWGYYGSGGLDWDYHAMYGWAYGLGGGEVSTAIMDQASDPNCGRWAMALSELLRSLSDEELDVVKGLADGSYENVDIEDANDGVKVIGGLLRDLDRNVRDVTITRIRLTPREGRGRSLRPQDFPEIYAEYKKGRDGGGN